MKPIEKEDIQKQIRNGRLCVIVKPSSPRNEVFGWDDARQALRVSIAAPPEDNKANVEVVKFFSKMLKKKVRIVSGLHNRKKGLAID